MWCELCGVSYSSSLPFPPSSLPSRSSLRAMQAVWVYGPGNPRIGCRRTGIPSSVLFSRLVRERLYELGCGCSLSPVESARTWSAVFEDSMGHASDKIVGAVLLKFEQFEDVSVVFDPQHTMVRDFWMVTKYDGNPLAFILVPRAFLPCPCPCPCPCPSLSLSPFLSLSLSLCAGIAPNGRQRPELWAESRPRGRAG